MINNKHEGTGILYLFLAINILSSFIIPYIIYFFRISLAPGYAGYIMMAAPLYLMSFITIIVIYSDLKKYYPDEAPIFWLATVLLFGAIGLLFYILMRKDFKHQVPKKEPNEEILNIPQCPFCDANLEPEWKICHACKKVIPR